MSRYPIDPSTAPAHSSTDTAPVYSYPQASGQPYKTHNAVSNNSFQQPPYYPQQNPTLPHLPPSQSQSLMYPSQVPSLLPPQVPSSHSHPSLLPPQVPSSHSHPSLQPPQVPSSHSHPSLLPPQVPSSHSHPSILPPQVPPSHSHPSLLPPQVPSSHSQSLSQGMSNLKMEPAYQYPGQNMNSISSAAPTQPALPPAQLSATNGQHVSVSAAGHSSSGHRTAPPYNTQPLAPSGQIASMLHAPAHPMPPSNSQLSAPTHRQAPAANVPPQMSTNPQSSSLFTPLAVKPPPPPASSQYPHPVHPSSLPWGQNIQRDPSAPGHQHLMQGQLQYPADQLIGAPSFQPSGSADPVSLSQQTMYTGPSQQQQPYGQSQFQPTGPSQFVPAPAFQQPVLPPELEPISLLDTRNILPKYIPVPPLPVTSVGVRTKTQFDPFMLCSTLNCIPHSKSLLNKSKLPFGILLQPFRDISSDKLPVVSTSCIIRCNNCRTYINPYISFLPGRKWKCNICHRANSLPDGFNSEDALRATATSGSYSEVQSSIVEYIANSDYALRPPQPPVYVFVLDVSHSSIVSGALSAFCETLIACLDELPGDTRTQVGLITFNHSIQFYGIRGTLPAHIYDIPDLEEVFLPTNADLLVYLKEARESFKQLLRDLPDIWANTHSNESCMGVAVECAFRMISQSGGRITVLVAQRPTKGSGAMSSEQATTYLKKNSQSIESIQLSASTDFYKKLSLVCCEKQVGVDLFVTCSQFTDLFSMAALSRYSSGQVRYYTTLSQEYFPNRTKAFQEDLYRYFTRRIGFEAVMRVRCSPGLALHTFHGNCFVRSTDLLALPNVNPDHSFAIQLSHEETLDDVDVAFLQSALLYTSVRGERRIRVATIALPVTTKLLDVYASANAQGIAAFIAKMAVDRLIDSSLGDARTGLINVVADLIKSYTPLNSHRKPNSVCLPSSLRLIPIYLLGILKHPMLRVNSTVQLDERSYQTILLKTLPLDELLASIYPTLHGLHDIVDKSELSNESDGDRIAVEILHGSAEKMSLVGAYLLDCGDIIIVYMGASVSAEFMQKVFGVSSPQEVVDDTSTSIKELPVIDNQVSERVRLLLSQLKTSRARSPVLVVLTDSSHYKMELPKRLIEDKFEETMSYYDFLNFLRSKISK